MASSVINKSTNHSSVVEIESECEGYEPETEEVEFDEEEEEDEVEEIIVDGKKVRVVRKRRRKCDSDFDVDSSEEKEPQATQSQLGWRISFFKRAFPANKKRKGFPNAAGKVYMEKRRPLWLPQFAVDSDYFSQASYFSEILAKDQLRKQAVLEQIYKPNFGEYAYSRAEQVSRNFVSKYLKGIHCLKFSPEGDYLVMGCGNGTIQMLQSCRKSIGVRTETKEFADPKIRDMNSKQTSVHCIRGYQRRITSVKFLPCRSRRKFFASSLTGRVYMGVLKNKRWKCYTFLKEIKNEINAMDLNSDGHRMATAGADSHIRIYDPNEMKLLHIYMRPGTVKGEGKIVTDGSQDYGHLKRICALKFDPQNPNIFITGGWDNIVKVWDQRTVMPVQSIAGPHLTTNSLDIFGQVILTGQWTCSESIQLWDMRCGTCLTTVQPLNRPICYNGEFMNNVQFIHSWEGPDITIPNIVGDLILAVGSGTKALEVISIKENMILHSTEEANALMALDHFQSLIAYGSVNQVYGIVSFFPFVGNLSQDMKFEDKETEDEMVKRFSSYGNPMGWHEVALDMNFMEAFASSKESESENLPDMEKKVEEFSNHCTRTSKTNKNMNNSTP